MYSMSWNLKLKVQQRNLKIPNKPQKLWKPHFRETVFPIFVTPGKGHVVALARF